MATFQKLLVLVLLCVGVNAQGVNAVATQEPELNTEGIILTCTDTQMIVEIPKTLLTGEMTGANVRFENEDDADNSYCLGEDKTNAGGDDIIELTTDLTACGTNRTENANQEQYTNRVIDRYPSGSVISRQFAIDIPLSCLYNRSQRVESVSYQLTDYTINKKLEEEGAYAFQFDIYTDETYKEVVDAYPISIGLNKKLYFAASVPSLGETIDLSILYCRATPTSNYDSTIFFEFIINGCSNDDNDTTITITIEGGYIIIRVEMITFMFINGDGLVYIHCILIVCKADDPDSQCNQKCPIAERKRRDVSSELNTKRFTRGPLRVVRSAQKQDSISRIDFSENDSTTQQEVTNAFNPWMVAMAAMATVVMALAAMMVVVLRKVSKISAAPQRGQY